MTRDEGECRGGRVSGVGCRGAEHSKYSPMFVVRSVSLVFPSTLPPSTLFLSVEEDEGRGRVF